MYRLLILLAAFVAWLPASVFGQSFQITPTQVDLAIAPGFNHMGVQVPISGTAGGFNFGALSVTSDASWVTAAIDGSVGAVSLTFQTASLINASNTATITVSGAGTTDTFFVKATVGPLNVVKLEDDPVRSRTYGIHQNGLNSGALVVIDPINNTKVGCLTVGKKPGDIAVSNDGSELIVINCVDESITAVDLATLRVKETIGLPQYENWGATDTTADVGYGPGSTLYYTDGSWAPVLYVFNRSTRQVLQTVMDDGNGFGDFAMSPDATSLFAWVQYGWSAGWAGSYIVKFSVDAQGRLTFVARTATTYPTVLMRDPLDAPLLIDNDAEHVFVKPLAVNPAAISETKRSFPKEVYAISPGGEIVSTNSGIFQTSTGNNLLSLPVATNVQTITSDYARLVYFNATARSIGTIDLMAEIGPALLNRNLFPADGAITLAPQALSWSPLPGVDRYQVYLGSSEVEVIAAGTGSPTYLGEVTTPSIGVNRTLTAGTHYFWRIDTVTQSGVVKGSIHRFTVSPIGADRSVIATATVQGHSAHVIPVQLTAASPTGWQASADKTWVTFESATGTTPSTMKVVLNASQLAKGVHTATVSVAVGGSAQAAFTIPVTLEVDALAITVMESDRNSGLVYAISEDKTQLGSSRAYLLEIDSVTQSIDRVVRAGTSGTDLAVHHGDGRVYVANWLPGSLLAFDMETLDLERTYNFSAFQGTGYGQNDVYRIAAGGPGRLLVEEQDQWVDISIFDTVAGTKLDNAFVREGGGEFGPGGRYYYHGENNSSGAEILKFDVTGDTFTEMASVRVESASYYGSRTVVVSENGEHVFWNGGMLDENLVVEWLIGKEIFSTTPDGKYAFGETQIFDTVAREAVFAMPVSTRVSAFNSTSNRLIVQSGNTIQFHVVGDSAGLNAPVLAAGAATTNSVALSWTDQSLETGFTLQRRVAGSATWMDVAITLGANVTNCIVTGLNPSTTYEFRIKADAPATSSAWSNVVSATTDFVILRKPIVTTGTASEVTATSVKLQGTVNPNGVSTTYRFEYGTTTSYGSSTLAIFAGQGTSAQTVSVTVTGLNPATNYHFRISATNNDGTSAGGDQVFTTAVSTSMAPIVATGSATSIGLTSATLGGSVNPNGSIATARFEFGTTPSLGSATPEFSTNSINATELVSRTVQSLAPGTTYYFRLSATNAAGTTTGVTKSFATLPLVLSPNLDAVDDEAFTTGRNAVVINVLGNDTGTALQIVEVSRATAGTVVVNPDGTITYSPSAAFEGIDTFTYRVTASSDGSDVATVTVRDTYAACTGNYNALVGTSLTRAQSAGAITINATPLGSFTGVLQFAGDSLPLKGQLRFDGQAFLDLKNRRGQPISLNFAIDPSNARLSGGVMINGVTSQFEAGKAIYDSVQNFAPQAGRYTLLLPRGESNAPSLRGDGFATMTVSTAGAVALTGRTGEGVPFSSKALVGPDSRFPLYAAVGAGRRASLQGWVKFRSEPEISDCDGTIGFDEPFDLTVSSTKSSSGVTIIVVGELPDPIQTSLVGSRYITPTPGTLILDWPDHESNGSFETGSFQSQIGILPITLTSKHKIRATVPGPFALKVDPKTGLISGTVRLELSPKAKLGTLHGVLFQRQAIGAGLWKAGSNVGWISIAPVGVSE